MRLCPEQVRRLAKSRGRSLSELLRAAGISRTAYYSLTRRPSVLPKTVRELARVLGVSPMEILDAASSDEATHQGRLREAQRILAADPSTSFENVWHTLCLLELDPIERLNRSLIRGRASAIHR
ncbi:MAG: helix-turn-helix transcriptional regulator [bacterium]|nr:helix-turn-helix transcriptional regulator [bacterium]